MTRKKVLDTPDTPLPIEEIDVDAFVARVGERVRKTRKARGISRRILSERSGVSQRYLAQLELGTGNISIALLLKIAVSLDTPIETLISDGSDLADHKQFVDLFARAEKAVQKRVLDILDPDNEKTARGKRIALIGLRGAGKSTLGALAGARLQIPFIELNEEIEQSNGMSVNETIELYGQEGYRLLEQQAIERLADRQDPFILAVAGGIVSEAENYAYLLRHYHTVWIKAAPEEHMERVKAQGDERPMAGNPEAFQQLQEILTSRERFYEKADAMVDTTGTPLETSVDDFMTLIKSRNFLA